jgi:hypothetical protein
MEATLRLYRAFGWNTLARNKGVRKISPMLEMKLSTELPLGPISSARERHSEMTDVKVIGSNSSKRRWRKRVTCLLLGSGKGFPRLRE